MVLSGDKEGERGAGTCLSRVPKVTRSSKALAREVGLVFKGEGCLPEDDGWQATMASVPIPGSLEFKGLEGKKLLWSKGLKVLRGYRRLRNKRIRAKNRELGHRKVWMGVGRSSNERVVGRMERRNEGGRVVLAQR